MSPRISLGGIQYIEEGSIRSHFPSYALANCRGCFFGMKHQVFQPDDESRIFGILQVHFYTNRSIDGPTSLSIPYGLPRILL